MALGRAAAEVLALWQWKRGPAVEGVAGLRGPHCFWLVARRGS